MSGLGTVSPPGPINKATMKSPNETREHLDLPKVAFFPWLGKFICSPVNQWL